MRPVDMGAGSWGEVRKVVRLFTGGELLSFFPTRKIPKPSPTASPLRFELDPEPLPETLTALGGIPLVVQAFRSRGLPQSGQEQVRVKQRERGYDEARFVESLVIVNVAGGEGVDDFARLRFLLFHMPGRLVHPARRILQPEWHAHSLLRSLRSIDSPLTHPDFPKTPPLSADWG